MSYRTILDEWVRYLFEDWLDIRGKPQLHPSVEPLIDKLRLFALDPNRKDDAWHCIEQIEKLHDHVHRENYKVSARMFLECGVAAYWMGNSHEAISFLTRSTSSFTEDHDKGVSCWLLGCVYWHANNPINALASWENGYRHFREQSTKSGRGSKLEEWYAGKIKEMEDAIKYAAQNESPPFPIRSAGKKPNTKRHLLQTLPVIGQIPAGTPLDVLPPPVDFVNADQVQINDKDYCIVSLLREEIVVHIPPGRRFYVLRVSGNSMNRCSPGPIEDGDYVILREQHTADNGDIVAAMIVKDQGEDEQRATLKRFVTRDGKIFLQPESDDPEFQKPVYSRSFASSNDEIQIRGVAVAVLKPL
ncbi:MAG: hypothetical protein L0287_08420 [Anaerolineae bacterium]|nr:hypothetical protein [Anaerolineae bacterium]MCI0610698.1 hypothetical protein [Anaerolineae bacterium]